MKEVWLNFIKTHGERLVFMLMALLLAGMLYLLDMKEEASVIFIGLAMMCYNKARETKEIKDTKPVKQ